MNKRTIIVTSVFSLMLVITLGYQNCGEKTVHRPVPPNKGQVSQQPTTPTNPANNADRAVLPSTSDADKKGKTGETEGDAAKKGMFCEKDDFGISFAAPITVEGKIRVKYNFEQDCNNVAKIESIELTGDQPCSKPNVEDGYLKAEGSDYYCTIINSLGSDAVYSLNIKLHAYTQSAQDNGPVDNDVVAVSSEKATDVYELKKTNIRVEDKEQLRNECKKACSQFVLNIQEEVSKMNQYSAATDIAGDLFTTFLCSGESSDSGACSASQLASDVGSGVSDYLCSQEASASWTRESLKYGCYELENFSCKEAEQLKNSCK